MELEIKQMMLEAKDEAKKITTQADKDAERKVKEKLGELKEQEDKAKKTEDRLIKKEELLDKRQQDIDTEVEKVKSKIDEVKEIKGQIEKIIEQKQGELEKVAGLSKEAAKNELFDTLEKQHEEAITIRLKKLETSGMETLERKAKEIEIKEVTEEDSKKLEKILKETLKGFKEAKKFGFVGLSPQAEKISATTTITATIFKVPKLVFKTFPPSFILSF